MDSSQLLKAQKKSQKYRKNILNIVNKAKGGHIGGSFSVIDILNVLYNHILSFDTKNPTSPDRDRLIFSKGHSCIALYVVLEDLGFFDRKDLEEYSKNGAQLGGHPKKNISQGIEISTGSLGHGLSVSVGIAKSVKMNCKKNKVFCIIGDGELNEGSTWEAILLAAQWKLDNLTLIVDYNNQISLDSLDNILSVSPLDKKFESFNWDTKVLDGHNHLDLYHEFRAKNKLHTPKVIIANTIKGKGVDFMERVPMWHYRGPSQIEYKKALKQLEGN